MSFRCDFDLATVDGISAPEALFNGRPWMLSFSPFIRRTALCNSMTVCDASASCCLANDLASDLLKRLGTTCRHFWLLGSLWRKRSSCWLTSSYDLMELVIMAPCRSSLPSALIARRVFCSQIWGRPSASEAVQDFVFFRGFQRRVSFCSFFSFLLAGPLLW